jgi:hypothetical protein
LAFVVENKTLLFIYLLFVIFCVEKGVARFFLLQHNKTGKNIPNYHKIDQMSIKIYQHLPLQDPLQFTQIKIFGLKIYHLATLEKNRYKSDKTSVSHVKYLSKVVFQDVRKCNCVAERS